MGVYIPLGIILDILSSLSFARVSLNANPNYTWDTRQPQTSSKLSRRTPMLILIWLHAFRNLLYNLCCVQNTLRFEVVAFAFFLPVYDNLCHVSDLSTVNCTRV